MCGVRVRTRAAADGSGLRLVEALDNDAIGAHFSGLGLQALYDSSGAAFAVRPKDAFTGCLEHRDFLERRRRIGIDLDL